MGFSVLFPRSVEIENHRLTILYYLLTAGIVTGLLYFFLAEKAYLIERTPSGKVTFWALNWLDDESATRANEAEDAKEMCKRLDKYEYLDESTFHFRDLQCIDICTST